MIALHSFSLTTVHCVRRLVRERQSVYVAVIAIAVALLLHGAARAVIVGNVPNVVPATTVNPEDYVGWAQGDPGWNNPTANGSNYVYLGDGWVLSARHVGYNASNGVSLQTMLPDGSLGPIETFYRIPGDYYYNYGYWQGSTRRYAVSNPTTIQSETGQAISLQDSVGTYFTDLQLFRINGDPGLPALTIASQPLPSDFTRATAPEVVIVGTGQGRQSAEVHYDVTENSATDWNWTVTTGQGDFQGYRRDSSALKRFGTNRLTDPHPNSLGDPSDAGALNYSDEFDAVVSDTRAVLELETTDGVTRDVVSLMTVFDNQTAPGTTPLEFQGVAGDSGSSVFYNRNGQWELAGIVNAVFRYTDQPAGATSYSVVYGNATLISDLSFYNQDYFNSIKYIVDSHANYSHVGDLNLDGVVSGDGTGPPETDDVTAFIVGWGYDNDTNLGTITSWKMGDLDRNGTTNVNDFLMLRTALNGEISSAVMAALFGDGSIEIPNGAVPEPASAVLASVAGTFLVLTLRRRAAGQVL